jgi:glycosyltransferase involved in cell wall biosynthesis
MEIIDVEINGNYEPLVSVLMTAYNREIFIKESVESVIHSTYKNIELIIVDDGSTDNTIDVVKALMLNDKRIKLFQNENNLGDYPNRNKAAVYAIGKYMLYVDSDDTIQPDAIEYCVKNLELHSTSDFSVIYPHQDVQSPQLLNATTAIRKHFFEKS